MYIPCIVASAVPISIENIVVGASPIVLKQSLEDGQLRKDLFDPWLLLLQNVDGFLPPALDVAIDAAVPAGVDGQSGGDDDDHQEKNPFGVHV